MPDQSQVNVFLLILYLKTDTSHENIVIRQKGGYYFIGYTGHWWSATGSDASDAWFRGLYYNAVYDHDLTNSKKVGFSVRCIEGILQAK